MSVSYLDLSRYLVVVASLVITAGLYDQGIKILRTKSARDFTGLIIVAIVFNEAAWLNYGLALNEWPIWVVGLANTPALVIVSWGYVKYGLDIQSLRQRISRLSRCWQRKGGDAR